MDTIALDADVNDLNKIETTLKSIFLHNQHVEIHIINFNIPHEWFVNINQYVNQFGSKIIDEKIDPNFLGDVQPSFDQIRKILFAYFLIPDLISTDKILYLGSDLIATDSLQSIFKINFDNKMLFAVPDYQNLDQFNSSVMLINNKRWREEKMSSKLIEMSKKQGLANDQSIINEAFKDKIGKLNLSYNYQIGLEKNAYWNNKQVVFDNYNRVPIPRIINYSGDDNPFNLISTGDLRNNWWQYHNLEWSDIVKHYGKFDKSKIRKTEFDAETFIFARVAETKDLELLIQKLPNVRFNIASYTDMSWLLKKLVKYDNVKLHPFVMNPTLDNLISNADFSLDINYLKEDDVTEKIVSQQKPILSFEETKNNNISYDKYYIFANDAQDEMVEAIKKIIDKKKETSAFDIRVKDIDESLDLILNEHKSVIRFGDGEFNIIRGESIFYQDYNKELALRLESIILSGNYDNTLICLPDVFEDLARYNDYAQRTYKKRFFPQNAAFLKRIEQTRNWYGSTFVSRPYIDLVDKSESPGYFEKLRQIWNQRDVLIVEGKYSRSGVGNDLFDNAKSIKRILCPSQNSYEKIEQIELAIRKYADNRLILLMLGPTAKVIVDDLQDLNNQKIDIGHIDSEYEWFKMGVTDKVKLKNKHTAEFNRDVNITPIHDKMYSSQIIERIE
ncbi:SP_1767 family glycosyltransferase [Lactobacillus gasseri]|jgi:glycosyltransferase family protein|uniref:SP_1767 family glycosyltransferase n=2 Tax=Lactobacillus gasseri TaxID=1596 RepID=UPI0034A18431